MLYKRRDTSLGTYKLRNCLYIYTYDSLGNEAFF